MTVYYPSENGQAIRRVSASSSGTVVYYYFRTAVTVNSHSDDKNTSNITVELQFRAGDANSKLYEWMDVSYKTSYDYSPTASLYINDTLIGTAKVINVKKPNGTYTNSITESYVEAKTASSITWNYDYGVWTAQGWKTIVSKTYDVAHSEDGTPPTIKCGFTTMQGSMSGNVRSWGVATSTDYKNSYSFGGKRDDSSFPVTNPYSNFWYYNGSQWIRAKKIFVYTGSGWSAGSRKARGYTNSGWSTN